VKETVEGVNVIVFGDVGIATYQSVGLTGDATEDREAPPVFRAVLVFQRREGRFRQVTALRVRRILSPGPDPWSPDYWNWRLAPRVSAPVPERVDDERPLAPRDRAIISEIRAQVGRLANVGLTSRSPEEQREDAAWFARWHEPGSVSITERGAILRRQPGAAVAEFEDRAFSKSVDGINVQLYGDLGIATWQSTLTLGTSRHFRCLQILRRRQDGWRIVADFAIRLVPQRGPDPWGWMR
jgi:ketosteroid isomerase-like protein